LLPTLVFVVGCVTLIVFRNALPPWLLAYRRRYKGRPPFAVEKTLLFCLTWILAFTLALGLRKSGLPVPDILRSIPPPIGAVVIAVGTFIWAYVQEEIQRQPPPPEDWLLWDLRDPKRTVPQSSKDEA
jgi:hypothetical protein